MSEPTDPTAAPPNAEVPPGSEQPRTLGDFLRAHGIDPDNPSISAKLGQRGIDPDEPLPEGFAADFFDGMESGCGGTCERSSTLGHHTSHEYKMSVETATGLSQLVATCANKGVAFNLGPNGEVSIAPNRPVDVMAALARAKPILIGLLSGLPLDPTDPQ